jgi:hypothetical protein
MNDSDLVPATCTRLSWPSRSAWTLALLLLACGTTAGSQPRKEHDNMDEFKFEIDRDGSFEADEEWLLFKNARLSTRGKPKIISGIGIAINAPREVQFSEGPDEGGSFSEGPRRLPEETQFIVCVATRFVYNMMGYESDFMDHVFLEAVDTRTHEAYGASALLADDSDIREHLIPPPKDMAEPETDHTNTTIGEVLRANLAKMMQLPAVETEYLVSASLDDYRSNALTVKLVRRKPSP